MRLARIIVILILLYEFLLSSFLAVGNQGCTVCLSSSSNNPRRWGRRGLETKNIPDQEGGRKHTKVEHATLGVSIQANRATQ